MIGCVHACISSGEERFSICCSRDLQLSRALSPAEWVDTSDTDAKGRSANVIASVMAGADAARSPQQHANGGDGDAKIDVLR